MSWYQATVSHDRIRRGEVVWLADTEDVGLRVDKGYLIPVDEPAWNRQLPEDAKWPKE